MATVPSTATKAVNDPITAAWANNNVKSPIDFINAPPECQVYDAAGLTVTNSTFTLLTFNTEAYDTDSMHSTSSNTSRININTSGMYEVELYVNLPTATYTVFSVNMRLNSGGASGGGTSVFTHQTGSPGGAPQQLYRSVKMPLTSGNYYEFFVFQTSGASRTTTTGNYLTGATFTWLHP